MKNCKLSSIIALVAITLTGHSQVLLTGHAQPPKHSPKVGSGIVPETFTINITASVQNPNSTIKGTKQTTANPVKNTINTASLLQLMAAAEYYEGNYPSSVFPAGAKIVWLNNADDFTASYFAVEDKYGNFLCDVSDLFQFQGDLSLFIFSGTQSTTTPLVSNMNQYFPGTLYYDDTSAGGGLYFYLSTMVHGTANDVLQANGINYVETIKGTWGNGIGAGTLNDYNMVISGSATAQGSTTYSL